MTFGGTNGDALTFSTPEFSSRGEKASNPQGSWARRYRATQRWRVAAKLGLDGAALGGVPRGPLAVVRGRFTGGLAVWVNRSVTTSEASPEILKTNFNSSYFGLLLFLKL